MAENVPDISRHFLRPWWSDVLIRDSRVPEMLPAFMGIPYIHVGQSDGGDLHMAENVPDISRHFLHPWR